jgi:hypothetical protein
MVSTASLGFAFLVGLLAVGTNPVPQVLVLPPAALVGAVLPLALLPLLLRRWPVALGFFLVWLVVEDLVRKLAGNDIRVYFIKDLVFLVVVAGFLLSPESRGAWREATGRARISLYALLAWAVVMGVPSGLQDWRVPLIGLRLDFMYAPLVAAGFVIGRDSDRLRRWISGLAVLGSAAAAIGIVQAVVGPDFLAPSEPTPGLGLLVTVRGLPESGPVYRPSGTFVSSGRFASMAIVALVLSLAAIIARRGRLRLRDLLAVSAAAGAVWVSGGRAGFLAGAAILALAVAAPRFAERRPSSTRALAVTASVVAALAAIALLAPALLSSRAVWYRETLDPRSARNEWAFRFSSYGGSTIHGIRTGGLMGHGTGTQSLGLQYIYGGEERSPRGLYEVEGGYASVAMEWGMIGLGLWLVWSVIWARRQWQAVKEARGTRLAAGGLVLFGSTLFFLFFGFLGGLQGFQNFLANAYFWLLSGTVFALPAAARSAVRMKEHHATT